jgi:hypothetical protein
MAENILIVFRTVLIERKHLSEISKQMIQSNVYVNIFTVL